MIFRFFLHRKEETDPPTTNGIMIAITTEVVTAEVDTRLMVEEAIRTITMTATTTPAPAIGTPNNKAGTKDIGEMEVEAILGGVEEEEEEEEEEEVVVVVEGGEMIEVIAVTLVAGDKVVEGIAGKIMEGPPLHLRDLMLVKM